MRLLSPLAIALFMAPPCVGRAQEPRRLEQPDSIPFELASALLSAGGFGSEPQILVGTAPGWVMPRMYVPAGARVLGSAFIGQSVTAIVDVPAGIDTSVSALKAQFLERGWVAPPRPPVYSGGGFRPAPFAAVSSRITLCDNQEMLSAYTRRHAGTNVYLVEHITTVNAGYSVCHPPEMPQRPEYRSPFPTLIDPPGSAEDHGNGPCMVSLGGNPIGLGMTMRSSMSPQDLLDHYGRQLTDSGWKPAPATAPGELKTWSHGFDRHAEPGHAHRYASLRRRGMSRGLHAGADIEKALMRGLVLLGSFVAASACASAPRPASSTPSDGSAPADVFVRRGVSDAFSPASGEAAVHAFRPQVAAYDSAGECLITRTAGSGATRVTAMFPDRQNAKSRVSLAFDSSGRLIQYSESRGVVPPVRLPPNTPRAQLDSAFRANIESSVTTNISLNYALDQALAVNRGGSRPSTGVIGTVRSMESLESLGNPRARMQRVRQLCGV